MPYTWDDFNRDFIIEHVTAVPIEKIIPQFKPEDVFKQFKPDEMEAYLKKLRDDNGKQPQTVRDESANYSKKQRRMPSKRKIIASTH